MKRQNGFRRGFTLIELLVVIAVIGLLTSILVPAVRKALTSAKRARALGQIQDLDAAIKRYYAEYNKMPAPKNRTDATSYNGEGDMLFEGADQARVIEVLIGANTNHNPRQIVFLDLDPKSFGEGLTVDEMLVLLQQGVPYKDPWSETPDAPNDDQQYRILMDLDFDDKIDLDGVAGIETEIRVKSAVYSLGEGGKKNADDPPFKTW